jgi:hypothetical protein
MNLYTVYGIPAVTRKIKQAVMLNISYAAYSINALAKANKLQNITPNQKVLRGFLNRRCRIITLATMTLSGDPIQMQARCINCRMPSSDGGYDSYPVCYTK